MIKEALASMFEEIMAMRSGRFIPYHKMAIAVALVVTVVFSVIFAHGTVFEGRIAVIDLDHSKSSSEFIKRVDASVYIDVAAVLTNPYSVTTLTSHDRTLGVLYIPDGFEEDLLTLHQQMRLRYYADYSNEAQNAEVIETLNEITAEFGAEFSVSVIADKARLSSQQAMVLASPLGVEIRRLFNPTFSATSGTVSAFLIFFSALYLGLTTLMVPGRLHVTGMFERGVLGRSPLSAMARMVPYAAFFTIAVSLMMGILTCFGQMRFAGNFLLYLPALFICAWCVGLMALVYAWNSPEPGHGASMMIFLVPPGFIMGGATMAVGVLPYAAYLFSHCFPLVWIYHFQRDIADRGLSLPYLLDIYGALIIYASLLGLLVTLRWHLSRRRLERGSQPLGSEPVPPPALADERR